MACLAIRLDHPNTYIRPRNEKGEPARVIMSVLINPENPNLDIVLVHGLNVWSNRTHAEDTWTSDPPGNRVHWIREFFPLHEETSRARVLVYSYNACAVFGAATTGVVAQAENLLSWLWLKREGFKLRPLIFIAHSMGGLIVKEALVQASVGSVKFGSIWVLTKGIMFFGTPHRGTNTNIYDILADILRTISSDPDPGFLGSLNKYSVEAERLHERFSTLQGRYQFASVYETRPHRIKPLGVIVPRLSALLGLPEDHETRIALDRDHNQICKFSCEDEEFQLIFSSLAALCKKATASFKHPRDYPTEEQHIATRGFDNVQQHTHTLNTDAKVSVEADMQRARSLLESQKTTVTVHDIDAKIRAHHSTTNSIATLSLIPQVIALLSALGVFLGLGWLVAGLVGSVIFSMVGRIINGLEDVETEQGHVFNLSRLTIQLIDDRLQAILTARQGLAVHKTAVLMDPGKETEVEDLLARLDTHGEELVQELRRRQPAAEDARRRVQVTEDFKEELRRALEPQDESWPRWLMSLMQRLLTWLFSLVAEIGRRIAGLVSSTPP